MRQIATQHERIPLGDVPELPEIDLVFTACRTGPDENVVDIIDFGKRSIDRWSIPVISIPKAVEQLQQHMPAERLPPGVIDHEVYFREHLMRPHIAHLSRDGKIVVCLSDNYNGFCVCVIDTLAGKAWVFPGNFEEELMLYTSTGSFTPDGKQWLFVRWPLKDALDIMNGQKRDAGCEVGSLLLDNCTARTLYRCQSRDGIHEVACSATGQYIVFSPFKFDLVIPYPSTSIAEDPDGYRRSHQAGVRSYYVVTVDVRDRRHSYTEIPVPAVAHSEFDPLEVDTFYHSAHNLCPAPEGVVVEGPAALYRMRVERGKSKIEACYTHDQFVRIRQHAVFIHGGRTILAVTNFPNAVELIDGKTMTLWRRIELFSAPELDFSATGNVVCPNYPETCFFVNPSRDGRYVVLGSSMGFRVYDVANDRLLDSVIPLELPEGYHDVGHTRSGGT